MRAYVLLHLLLSNLFRYYKYEGNTSFGVKKFMKNPYLYGYLPLITILLFSLTFGIYAIAASL